MRALPFIPNQLYKRSSIHDEFGGNRQGGIAPSAKFPYIFIFSGKSGSQFGYKDGWDNSNIYSYTGEGQEGDMKFIKGNLALKEHLNTGKRVLFFEIEGKGFVKFVSELEFFDADYFETPDKNREIRIGIRFFLKRIGAFIPVKPEQLSLNAINDEPKKLLELNIPNVTERAGLVISRVGQGAYRKRILHRWEYKCAVTEFNRLDVLIASHIVPWATATNDERLDVNNGILLSPTYDALFDKHMISFDNAGKIILSDSIEVSAFNKIGVTGKEQIVGLSQFNFEYLRRHQEMIYNK
jgi:5-methylcytosine-specific restriction protein A